MLAILSLGLVLYSVCASTQPATPAAPAAPPLTSPASPPFKLMDKIPFQLGGVSQDLAYTYYVGYLYDKQGKKTHVFRAVFASLGDNCNTSVPRIGIDAPSSSPSSKAELVLKELPDKFEDPTDAMNPRNGLTFELTGGWAAVEFVRLPPSSSLEPRSVEIAAFDAGVNAPEEKAFPGLFPIPWRFITSDGFRTGATSSVYFVAVTPSPNGKIDVRCFPQCGDVVYAPLKTTSPAGVSDKFSDSRPLAADRTASLLRDQTAPNDPSKNSSQEEVPTRNSDKSGFLTQAKQFFEQVKAKHPDNQPAHPPCP